MTADHSSAFRAAPPGLFFLQESLHPFSFDESEVLDHAHMVLGAVALIEGFQPFTGESSALIAEAELPFLQQFALITHVGTVFPSGNTAGTVFSVESLFVQVPLHKLIGNAQAAIHPAGSNELFLHVMPPPKNVHISS